MSRNILNRQANNIFVNTLEDGEATEIEQVTGTTSTKCNVSFKTNTSEDTSPAGTDLLLVADASTGKVLKFSSIANVVKAAPEGGFFEKTGNDIRTDATTDNLLLGIASNTSTRRLLVDMNSQFGATGGTEFSNGAINLTTSTLQLDNGSTFVFNYNNSAKTTLAAASATVDRTLTLPDTTGTIVTTGQLTSFITASSTDTLTNKTIAATSNTIQTFTGNSSATITTPSTTGTLALTSELTQAADITSTGTNALDITRPSTTTITLNTGPDLELTSLDMKATSTTAGGKISLAKPTESSNNNNEFRIINSIDGTHTGINQKRLLIRRINNSAGGAQNRQADFFSCGDFNGTDKVVMGAKQIVFFSEGTDSTTPASEKFLTFDFDNSTSNKTMLIKDPTDGEIIKFVEDSTGSVDAITFGNSTDSTVINSSSSGIKMESNLLVSSDGSNLIKYVTSNNNIFFGGGSASSNTITVLRANTDIEIACGTGDLIKFFVGDRGTASNEVVRVESTGALVFHNATQKLLGFSDSGVIKNIAGTEAEGTGFTTKLGNTAEKTDIITGSQKNCSFKYGTGLTTGLVMSTNVDGNPFYQLNISAAGRKWQFQADDNIVLYNSSSVAQKTVDVTVVSERQFKKDIVALDTTAALDIINQLKPCSFKYKEEANIDSDTHTGFIIDEVEPVFSEPIITISAQEQDGDLSATEERKFISLPKLIPTLVSSIQKLTERIAGLESIIAANNLTV